MSKMAKSRWPPAYRKTNIFTNNFAPTYYRYINNISILMFPGIVKSLLCQYKQTQLGIAVKLRLTLFWLIVFSLLIMLGWFPYSDIRADEELLVDFLQNMKFKMPALRSLKLFFEQKSTIFFQRLQ